MSLTTVTQALYAALAGASDASVGMRRAGLSTPCLVYAMTGAQLDMVMTGVPTLKHWTISAEVECVADTVGEATALVDSVAALFTGPINSTTYKCSIILASFSVQFVTETPDDGQQDAERICSISLTLLVQEDP